MQPGSAGSLKIRVALVEELGADAYAYGQLTSDQPDARPWGIRCPGHQTPHINEELHIALDPGAVYLFNPETGVRLG